MTENDKKLLNTFEEKLRHFISLYQEVKEENTSLRRLLSEKEAEITRIENNRKELEVQYTAIN